MMCSHHCDIFRLLLLFLSAVFMEDVSALSVHLPAASKLLLVTALSVNESQCRAFLLLCSLRNSIEFRSEARLDVWSFFWINFLVSLSVASFRHLQNFKKRNIELMQWKNFAVLNRLYVILHLQVWTAAAVGRGDSKLQIYQQGVHLLLTLCIMGDYLKNKSILQSQKWQQWKIHQLSWNND